MYLNYLYQFRYQEFTMFYFKFRPKKLLLLGITFLYIFTIVYVTRKATEQSSIIRDAQLSKNVTEKSLSDTLENPPAADSGILISEKLAVLVLVCDRLTVRRTLSQLLKYRPSPSKFPIIVSQDCGLRATRVKSLVKKSYGKRITYLTHPYYDASLIKIKKTVPTHMQGYYHISAHYGWALNYTFFKLGYENVIVVEDDLDIAPDFFEYFEATLPILKSDPTLWCISAFNDNGKASQIDEDKTDLLYRTDFFPGLGWMLTKSLWDELNTKWPEKFWDDWMRNSEQRNGRACIHPEVSRTKTFGRHGVSNGQFFDEFLDQIVLNQEFIQFMTKNLGYLRKTEYDKLYLLRVNSAIPISLNKLSQPNNLDSPLDANTSYKLLYRNQAEFTEIANEIGIMNDFKDGVIRNGYMGIVPVMFHRTKTSAGKRVYLVPSSDTETTTDV